MCMPCFFDAVVLALLAGNSFCVTHQGLTMNGFVFGKFNGKTDAVVYFRFDDDGSRWLIGDLEPVNVYYYDNNKKLLQQENVFVNLSKLRRAGNSVHSVRFRRPNGAGWLRLGLGISPLESPFIPLP